MADNHQSKWAEALQTGYAETLFASFPKDAELAEKFNRPYTE